MEPDAVETVLVAGARAAYAISTHRGDTVVAVANCRRVRTAVR
jgi:hypothetical protein